MITKIWIVLLYFFFLMSIAEDIYTYVCIRTHNNNVMSISPPLSREFTAYGTPKYPPTSWPQRPF